MYFFRLLCYCFFLFSPYTLMAQQPVQTIRGTLKDAASGDPVPFATVLVKGTNQAAIADSLGNFVIEQVPVGRYDIEATIIGYEPSVQSGIILSSAKETIIEFSMKENRNTLNEVVIKPVTDKEKPLNNMATTSARMLSVEEASRYAGGFDDPARLVASFAGVAGGIGNNGIVVRGNNPQALQWKMEGVEIPNPNHFADLATFGGGGLTALSSRLLANSDFFSGAFPAEYNNALSGVFDIFMRNGNNRQHEHTIQAGVIGLEASSEGPFKKGGASSYLFNYRYSTLALIGPLLSNDAAVRFQDLSFKLNFPTKKAGTFSLWGIGLMDRSGQEAKTDSLEWKYQKDKETEEVKQFMAAAGLTHRIKLTDQSYLKTTLAFTTGGIDLKSDSLNRQLRHIPERRINSYNTNIVINSLVNTKFSSRHTNKTGIALTGLSYDMHFKKQVIPASALQTVLDEHGFSCLLAGYTQSSYSITDALTMNAGVNAQFFTLNKHYTIEPRIGFRYQLDEKQSLSTAYGLHSRLERINSYFAKDIINGDQPLNRDMDFTKAHHIVLGYSRRMGERMHLTVEAYYQHLFNVPVIKDSSYSFINLQNDWFFNRKLENSGKGRNFGLDITLEKYMSEGYYWMLTASVFDSKYTGGDGVWRNTRFNRNFMFNALGGKEWYLGAGNQNTLGINIKVSLLGGDRYTPVDEPASLAVQDVVYDEREAFSRQNHPAFVTHFTVNYRVNRKKTSHEIALKVINATMYKEYLGFQYNYLEHTIDKYSEATFIPNLSYKIEF